MYHKPTVRSSKYMFSLDHILVRFIFSLTIFFIINYFNPATHTASWIITVLGALILVILDEVALSSIQITTHMYTETLSSFTISFIVLALFSLFVDGYKLQFLWVLMYAIAYSLISSSIQEHIY